MKRLDGAKSEMASPTVTQVHSIPRDPTDQLTRPQSTPTDMELKERWMNGGTDGWMDRCTDGWMVGVFYAT